MKIKPPKNVYLKQVLLALLIINICYILVVSLIRIAHIKYDASIILDSKNKILKLVKNKNMDITEAFNHFVSASYKKDHDLTLLQINGIPLSTSSKFKTPRYIDQEFINELKKYTHEYDDVFRIKDVKLTQLTKDTFLVFDFDLPAAPRSIIIPLSISDLEKTQYKVVIASYLIVMFTVFVVFFTSKKLAGRYIKTETTKANNLFQSIIEGNRGIRLDKTNIREVDPLIDSFNAMISKLEQDLMDLAEKDIEIKNLIQETSHDFKTPLTSINSRAQNVRDFFDKYSKEQIIANMDTIHKEINYLAKMLESMIFITGISITTQDQKNIDLSDLVTQEVDKVNYETIEISSDIEDDIFLEANELHFQRLVKNLLDNAMKNANDLIEVTLKKVDNHFELVVENDGASIIDKEKYGKRIKSRKIDTSDRLKISMGLGSVIICKIVDSMNGNLELLDRSGDGVKIKITIPLNDT